MYKGEYKQYNKITLLLLWCINKIKEQYVILYSINKNTKIKIDSFICIEYTKRKRKKDWQNVFTRFSILNPFG